MATYTSGPEEAFLVDIAMLPPFDPFNWNELPPLTSTLLLYESS